MEYIPAIITAIGVIITAWFAYNQKTKDKMTDLKIEQIRAETAEKKKRRADNSAIVHGELWEALHELHADRVYIVQPHPLGNESMVSIYFESKRKGVESMKPKIQNLKMCECAAFCADMAKNLYMFFDDTNLKAIHNYRCTGKRPIREIASFSLRNKQGCNQAVKRQHPRLGGVYLLRVHPRCRGERR